MEEMRSIQKGAQAVSLVRNTKSEIASGSSQGSSSQVSAQAQSSKSLPQDKNVSHDASVTEKKSMNEKQIDYASAVKISKSIENALNASSKEVQFAVSPEEKSPNKISFKVVDKSTGEVVREFPSEEIRSLEEKATAHLTQGLILDSSV